MYKYHNPFYKLKSFPDITNNHLTLYIFIYELSSFLLDYSSHNL